MRFVLIYLAGFGLFWYIATWLDRTGRCKALGKADIRRLSIFWPMALPLIIFDRALWLLDEIKFLIRDITHGGWNGRHTH